MDVWGRRVNAELDAQRRATPQALVEFLARDDVDCVRVDAIGAVK
jgi:hypothetical protein